MKRSLRPRKRLKRKARKPNPRPSHVLKGKKGEKISAETRMLNSAANAFMMGSLFNLLSAFVGLPPFPSYPLWPDYRKAKVKVIEPPRDDEPKK